MDGVSQFPRLRGVEILEVVGRGGFATVYRGYQEAYHRDVAVKVLQRSDLDADARHRFDRECQVMGALSNHPYIVTLYIAGFTEDERPYIMMPYVAGGTLEDRVRSGGAMDWKEVVTTGVRLAGALETAHRAGVLHRDIKPANILRAEYGDVLSDFGIARIAGGHETQSGVITASIAHAPPEVLDGQAPGARADVYSLSSTLFEALLGRPAFGQTSESVGYASMIRRILLDAPPPLPPDIVPPEIAEVIRRALSKDKADRHASAREFGEELRAAQHSLSEVPTDMLVLGAATASSGRAESIDDDGQTIVVVAPPTPPTEAVSPDISTPDESNHRGRRWALAGLVGLVAIAVVVGLVVATAGDGEPERVSSADTAAAGPAVASEPPTTEVGSMNRAPPTVSADVTPLALAPGDQVRLQLLNPGVQSELLAELVRGFEAENANITVEIVERVNYEEALDSLLTGEVEPDVALLSDRGVQSVLDRVNYIPIQDFVARDGFDSTRLLPNAGDKYATENGSAAMPFNVAVPMVYANADLLTRAGIDVAAGDSLTIGELLDRCVLLADLATTCIEFGQPAFLFTELITNSGGRVFDTDGFEGSATAAGFDTSVGRASFEFLVEPVIDGLAQDRGANRLFEEAEAAFYIDTSSALGSIDRDVEAGGEDVELLAIGIPHIDGVEPSGIVPGGGALWIMDRDDDRRAIGSWLLVKYLSELPQLNAYHQASGYVPPRSDAGDDDGFLDFWSSAPVFRGAYDELVEGAGQALPNERDGRAGPFHQIDLAIESRVDQARNRTLTTDQAFDALVDDVNTLLSNYAESSG